VKREEKESGWSWVQRAKVATRPSEKDATKPNNNIKDFIVTSIASDKILFSKLFICCFVICSLAAICLLTPLLTALVGILLVAVMKRVQTAQRCVSKGMIYKFLALLLPTAWLVASAATLVRHVLPWNQRGSDQYHRLSKAYDLLMDETEFLRWQAEYNSITRDGSIFLCHYYALTFGMVWGKRICCLWNRAYSASSTLFAFTDTLIAS